MPISPSTQRPPWTSSDAPLRTRLEFGTRIFSQRTRHEFGAYLDKIRESASAEQVAAVREVYGDSYLAPATAPVNAPE